MRKKIVGISIFYAVQKKKDTSFDVFMFSLQIQALTYRVLDPGKKLEGTGFRRSE